MAIRPSAGSETRYWTWHMAAGIAIFVLLGLHMATMHLGSLTGFLVADHTEHATSPANSQARDASLGLALAYIALLGLALYHGFYGLRTIIFELTLKPQTEKVVTAVLVIVGLGLFGLGAWAAIAAHSAAGASLAEPGAIVVKGW
jgi:succinate dehydrogenase hydrophobic anchor subunit